MFSLPTINDVDLYNGVAMYMYINMDCQLKGLETDQMTRDSFLSMWV